MLHPHRRLSIYPIAVHAAALLPLAILIYDFYAGRLSVNPIQDATFRTGKPALVLLILTLACTPANTLFRFRAGLRVRKLLGLYAFAYASLHFLIFAGLDFGFDARLIYDILFKKPYALAGLSAFILMLPLAITSTKSWMRRLGRRWKRLHRLIYFAGIVAAIHYVWLVKSDIREPLIYGATIGLLLVLRIPITQHVVGRIGHLITHTLRQDHENKSDDVRQLQETE